jgi:ribonuclease HI
VIATNNTMELTGLLKAIELACQCDVESVTVWCDSQYAVKGANEWRHGWKAKGWRRGSDKAKEKNQSLANVDLWKAIDEALGSPRAANIIIKWLKGHQGTVGNERADELAEMGRAMVQETRQFQGEDLDAEYRRVMAG